MWVQSTPAIAGRRILSQPSGLMALRFQSTPAIAGRRIPEKRQESQPGEDVSIHSGHCWPENPYEHPPWGDERSFNPLRPLLAGESVGMPHAGRGIVVSIHSGHCWPENREPASDRKGASGFNPLRPLLAGESAAEREFVNAGTVSIHSGHCWPENHGRACICGAAACFNPLRPLLAGESAGYGFIVRYSAVSIHSGHCWPENQTSHPICKCGIEVSIHSGHCWPENPGPPARLNGPRLRFNPLRPLLAGESRPSLTPYADNVFQSTPAIAGRRIPRWTGPVPPTECFNPLRPLLAGESQIFEPRKCLITVSIHSGHCWPENHPASGWCAAGLERFNPLRPLLAGESTAHGPWQSATTFQSTPAIAGRRIDGEKPPSAQKLFQSTPAIAGRRIDRRGCGCDCSRWFQSTPAIAGRRIVAAEREFVKAATVSIHSGHCWPENPAQSQAARTRSRFNPLRPLLAGESWQRSGSS